MSDKDRGAKREVFVISMAAEITGMHAQTLRTYDRMGLVTPERTRGGGRRYSREDIDRLMEIQRLSHEEGVNLAGIKTIIDQQSRIDQLEDDNAALRHRLAEAQEKIQALLAQAGQAGQARQGGQAGQAGPGSSPGSAVERRRGEIVHVPRSTAVVMWEPRRRRRGNSGS